MTISAYQNLLKEKKISAKELIQDLKNRSEKYKNLNTIILNNYDKVIENVKDNQIPIALKDNFHEKNEKTTAGSKMLRDFIAPVDCTVYKRLKENLNCVSVCKTNLDEFATGSSGKTSFFGHTLSPWKNKLGEYMSPGGSSSGSAAALSAGLCLAATGSDTGGSIRQPAAWCGLVGYKPTYGVLSRYGIVDYSSDLDCPGFFTHTVEDCKFLLNGTAGEDENDYTSVNLPVTTRRKKLAIIEGLECDNLVQNKIDESVKIFEALGYEITKHKKFSFLDYIIPIYYILSSSGLASNLSRYNGVFYNRDVKIESLSDIFQKCRGDGFGEEVQRRLIMGNYSMYSGNVDGFYNKARKILTQVSQELNAIFENADFIIMPTTPGHGMTFKESQDPDPIRMFLCDIYTCFVNMIGLPGVNVPVGLCQKTGTPIGIQLVGKALSDKVLLEEAQILDKHFNFYENFSLLGTGAI